MRKIFMLFALIAFSRANAQFTCCSIKSPLSDAAMEAAFKSAHESPLENNFHGHGTWITYKTADGQTARAHQIKSTQTTDQWLFIFHEWWGLNNHIIQRGDELWHEFNVNILIIDVYDGKITTSADTAGKYMQALNQERVQNILKGAYDYVGKDAKVATIGWCMGGVMSVNSALAGGTNVIGCVTYYGLPEVTVDQLKNLNCSIRGLFAEKDAWINPKLVGKFEEKMKKAGKQFPTSWYDADHAFANPSNPQFNKEATAQANAEASLYLRKTFGK